MSPYRISAMRAEPHSGHFAGFSKYSYRFVMLILKQVVSKTRKTTRRASKPAGGGGRRKISDYPDYKLQLAAYAVAWGEMTGHFPEVCMNLHVRSDFSIAEANAFTAAEMFPLFQTFLAAKRLFEWQSSQNSSIGQNVTRCSTFAFGST
jgi:hypothetical protein